MNISNFSGHCCGCGECYAICPTHAITMQLNKQGFLYPEINEKKCMGCSMCVSHCSFNITEISSSGTPLAYAVKHIDEEVRAASRSGGIFTALSDLVFNQGGVVYGCVLQNNREAVHIRAVTAQERDLMRGSKYIQSRIQDVFVAVREDLRQGLWVLFSGTACQINAIKDFCKKESGKLLLVDIVCHGVPSPLVWSDYLDYVERKTKKKIISVDFRDKQSFGWAAHKDTEIFSDGSKHSDDVFTKLFYGHNILRKDCFECPYKNLNRVGDISIADCWGIGAVNPEFDDDKGVSLVLVNTNKGKTFYDKLNEIDCLEIDINNFLQPPLQNNWPIPQNYDAFWKYYYKHSFEKVINRFVYEKSTFFQKIKNKVYCVLRRIYRKIFKRG